MSRSILHRILPVLLIFVFMAAPVCADPSPTEQVKATIDQVLAVLKDRSMAADARRQQLSTLIRARFDFNIMSQRTLGKHWQNATADEQKRFVRLFSDLLEASYLGRIEAYTDEVISYIGERQLKDRAEVKTSIRTGGDNLTIDYRMVLIDGEWYVYDVIVADVSLIKNYRSSYGQIVDNEGFAGLFTRMEAKIEQLRQPAGKNS